MKIRRLRQDEKGKLDEICSLAFSVPAEGKNAEEDPLIAEVYGAFLEDGETLVAVVGTPESETYWNGKGFRTVGIGGVATRPEYRKMGAVREIFEEIFRLAPQRGWAVSYLYPFSYDFYRKFGYERVMKRVQIRVPAYVLEKFPHSASARLYTGDGSVKTEDLLAVYKGYAERYNGMFRRTSAGAYSDTPYQSLRQTYVWYDGETPAALATFRCADNVMTVSELCYCSARALRGMLGFLRLFRGQVSEYRFAELPPDSELELLIGEYIDAAYTVESGAMGRVLLPEQFLKNAPYPSSYGHFRLQIADSLAYNRGVYAVEYGRGEAQVIRLPFDSAYDLSLEIPALSRILLGGGVDARRAPYLDGVKLEGNADDFFRVFGGGVSYMFEKF